MSEYKTDSTTKKDGRWYKSPTGKRHQRRWQPASSSKQRSHPERLGTLTSQQERHLKRLRAMMFHLPPSSAQFPRIRTTQTPTQNNHDPFFDTAAITPPQPSHRRKGSRSKSWVHQISRCCQSLLTCIERYPSLLWGTIWIVLFFLGVVAFLALSNPLYTTTPITPPKPPDLIETNDELPLWSFGAIALSCAGGCWWLSRWLNRKDSPE